LAGVALDTNVLGYAAGIREVDADDTKVDEAEALIATLQIDQVIVLPAQVLLELHYLLVRRGRRSLLEAALIVGEYVGGNRVVPTTADVIADAFDLAAAHRMQTFDAVILAAAASAQCDVLYSEDMQHGFEWGRVTVLNPFA
jgi:predicted nucleic acid-binding protein